MRESGRVRHVLLLLAALGLALLQAAGCSLLQTTAPKPPQTFDSTYQKYLLKAEGGDPESQNAVGFMLYHGEGVRMDRAQARRWFERAAGGGSARAARNLAALATSRPAIAATSAPMLELPARPRTKAYDPGERLFMTYCGGCHGFNGIAHYEYAPSFAFGERLEKPDADLMRSLRNGHAEMPSWEEKLPLEYLVLILSTIRRLPERYDAGIDAAMNDAPDFYFVFGPMEARRLSQP